MAVVPQISGLIDKLLGLGAVKKQNQLEPMAADLIPVKIEIFEECAIQTR